MNSSLNDIRRCCPLLGTFVEISVSHGDATQAHAAIDAAFAAIARVQALMSFHDPRSEVSQLNRCAAKEAVPVGPETYRVLEYAKFLHGRTGGIFDIAASGPQEHRGTTADIELRPDHCVHFSRPLRIDLGGIAKGFAVDQAVQVLQKEGMDAALVNAGGDMRCFGAQGMPVWVRHPAMPGQFVPLPALKNAALATSANSYSASLHLHGRTKKPMRRPFSVSVRAASCLTADALTKAVLALGEGSIPVLSACDADAFIVYPDNRIIYLEKEPA